MRDRAKHPLVLFLAVLASSDTTALYLRLSKARNHTPGLRRLSLPAPPPQPMPVIDPKDYGINAWITGDDDWMTLVQYGGPQS